MGDGSMASHVCTLENALVGGRKTPPVEVAVDVHSKCKWGLCTIWWQEKRHQRKLLWVKTILGASRSRMQQPIAGSTRTRSGEGLCPCANCNWWWWWFYVVFYAWCVCGVQYCMTAVCGASQYCVVALVILCSVLRSVVGLVTCTAW